MIESVSVQNNYYILRIDWFYFRIHSDKLKNLDFPIYHGDIRREYPYPIVSLPDATDHVKFLNLLKGSTTYGGIADVEIALGTLFCLLSEAPQNKQARDNHTLSSQVSLDLVVDICQVFKKRMGKTLHQAKQYLPTMLKNQDEVFLKKLVANTQYAKTPLLAIPFLKNGLLSSFLANTRMKQLKLDTESNNGSTTTAGASLYSKIKSKYNNFIK